MQNEVDTISTSASTATRQKSARQARVLSALRNRGENAALSVRAISAEKRGENQAHETDCPYGTGRSAPH